MDEQPFIVTFPGTSDAEANQYAGDLASTLRTSLKGVVVEQRRLRPDSQDFGATLAIVLGTASATALANGVAGWIARHSGAVIEISQNGIVVGKNLDSKDAAAIAKAFSKR